MVSRRILRAALIVALSAGARTAAADDVAAARVAYSHGTKEYKKGDFDAAATLFARADELAPNAGALEAALRAAVKADRAVLGMELVRRSQSRSPDGTLLEAVELARSEFRARVGKLTVVCTGCAPTVDGKAWEPGQTRWVEVGYHLVALDTSETAPKRLVRVLAGKGTRFTPTSAAESDAPSSPATAARRAPAPPAAEPERATPPPIRGLSPAWFWASAGVTVALGAATVASLVDLGSKHDEYMKKPSLQGAADGEAAETRTHVLLGFSGAALLSTAAIGIFAVHWKDPQAPPTKLTGSVAPNAGGATAVVAGRF